MFRLVLRAATLLRPRLSCRRESLEIRAFGIRPNNKTPDDSDRVRNPNVRCLHFPFVQPISVPPYIIHGSGPLLVGTIGIHFRCFNIFLTLVRKLTIFQQSPPFRGSSGSRASFPPLPSLKIFFPDWVFTFPFNSTIFHLPMSSPSLGELFPLAIQCILFLP